MSDTPISGTLNNVPSLETGAEPEVAVSAPGQRESLGESLGESEPATSSLPATPAAGGGQTPPDELYQFMLGLPDRGAEPGGPLDSYRDSNLGSLTPMERIIDHLDPTDVASLSQTSKAMNQKMKATGQQFMHAVYTDPETNLHALLSPSAGGISQGEMKDRPELAAIEDPSARAMLAYKMAGLDPRTELETPLKNSSVERLNHVKFLSGGAFVGYQVNAGRAGTDAEAIYQKRLDDHSKEVERLRSDRDRLQSDGQSVKNLNRRLKKLEDREPKRPPTAPQRTGSEFEYHTGGGIHSGSSETVAGIPPGRAMGGAYMKGEAKSGEKRSFRISRYGPFQTDPAKMASFYEPIPEPGEGSGSGQETEDPLKALSSKDLIKQGSAAEEAGEMDLAQRYRAEADRRMQQPRLDQEAALEGRMRQLRRERQTPEGSR